MAVIQTRVLTSHLRARDTGKVSEVGGCGGNIYHCYNYFHKAALQYIQHIQYLLLFKRGLDCSNIYCFDPLL